MTDGKANINLEKQIHSDSGENILNIKMNVVDNYKDIKSKGKKILSWIVSTNIYSVTQKKHSKVAIEKRFFA